MKIGVAGFQHETNRFSPIPTTLADFEKEDGWPGLTAGSKLFEVFPPMNIPLGGFLNYAENHHEIIPILWASAEPGGLIEDAAFDEITGRIVDEIAAALPVDGVYLDLHGAMVTESFEDGEGELLARLRARLGREIPVVISLDLHANLTEQIVSLADVITIFRTYPHLDMAQTGYRAAQLLDEVLVSGKRPCFAYRKLPMIIPLQSQCTEIEPCRSIYSLIADDNSLALAHADIAMGFPPSDIAENGPAIVTYSYCESNAEHKASQLEQAFLDYEKHFPYPLYSADEGVKLALQSSADGASVLLADIQDNSGAGATSDSTGLLRSLANHHVTKCVLAALYDPKAVKLAHEQGVGGVFNCQLGGQFGGHEYIPYSGTFKVVALSNGQFEYHGEMMRGGIANIGPACALRLEHGEAEIDIVVTSERIQCLDQAIIRHLGIEPVEMAILAIKSTVHFRADFASIVDKIILIESPGFNPCQFNHDLLPRLRPGVRIL